MLYFESNISQINIPHVLKINVKLFFERIHQHRILAFIFSVYLKTDFWKTNNDSY